MSLVLRHAPEDVPVKPDARGWANIDDLIAASDGKLTRDIVLTVVATSDKQRFSLSPNGDMVRANQGHSINVDLGLLAQSPPDTLFHGTAKPNLETILVEGLKPMSRQHVHLSSDAETARKVGMRHGAPIVLIVNAKAMSDAGHQFYCSENGVWLTNLVAPEFLSLPI